MSRELPQIKIDNPGVFILPDGEVPVASLRVLRDQQGRPDELIFVFDQTLRAKLKRQKRVQFQLRNSPKRVELDAIGAPCCDQEALKLGLRHLHLTMLSPDLLEMISALMQTAV